MKKGIIYIATGKKHINMALVSAASVKKHMPRLSITIMADRKVKSQNIDKNIIITNPVYGFEDKVKNISKTPYDYTLFLDADTYVCDDISELFELLMNFDIAISHLSHKGGVRFVSNIPKSFTAFNSGVILFRNSPDVKQFFSNWKQNYSQIIQKHPEIKYKYGINDEHAFAQSLYEGKIRFVTLSEKYNFRAKCGFIKGKVKIIHRYDTKMGFEFINKTINTKKCKRGYIFTPHNIKIINFKKSKINYQKYSTRIKIMIDRALGYLHRKL